MERFRAIASSTARSCFKSSSRRVDFFALFADDDDELDLLELFVAFSAEVLLLDAAGGDRFFVAASTICKLKELLESFCIKTISEAFDLLFLLASLRSLMILSRERGLCPFRDDSLELDESDEPLSEALESDDPLIKTINSINKSHQK